MTTLESIELDVGRALNKNGVFVPGLTQADLLGLVDRARDAERALLEARAEWVNRGAHIVALQSEIDRLERVERAAKRVLKVVARVVDLPHISELGELADEIYGKAMRG